MHNFNDSWYNLTFFYYFNCVLLCYIKTIFDPWIIFRHDG